MERILVVDDERAMRMGVSEVLERQGFAGTAVDSGAAALTALGLHALQHRGQEAAGIVLKSERFT